MKKLITTHKIMPRKLRFMANKDAPSFAISRIEEAMTVNGRILAIGCAISGKEEIGKKIPERINCGNVKSKTIGRIDSCVLAKLPRKNPMHRKINAPNKIAP